MKRLLLLRHAQAEPKPPLGDDFERALSPLGRAEAAALGRFLQKNDLLPQHALVSGAKRARETWEAIAAFLGHNRHETVDDSLYSIAPQGLLFEVGRFPDSAERCLVVGHNPAIHAFVAGLMGSRSDPEAARLLRRDMPPATLAILVFPASTWQDVVPGSGTLEAFLPPDLIAGAMQRT